MKVKIKQFDTSVSLPAYKTSGAAGMDLYARAETIIEPRSVGYVSLNIALEVPEGYWVLLAARSSTHKQGIMAANGIGIGDADFNGDNDEYHFAAFNFTDEPVTIEKGQRIAQMIILPYEKVDFVPVDHLGNDDRGKFGSTGTH